MICMASIPIDQLYGAYFAEPMQSPLLKLGPPIQVLLVEDSVEAARLTRSLISEGGDEMFRVEWKDNLQQAMNRLAQPGIDVVLLDLGMPELSGYRTHLAITLVVGKTVPVVILTSDDSPMSREITIHQGAASYLLKHETSSSQLRQALHAAVSGR